ncbi:MAG: ABC transporter permease [Gammaproteobacteria bacterium]|jgi:simple sugar transport system permease protein|nr:ABC transporter permease [Gammaproteobacteria bacterium]MBT3722103.1 ABC transporter permease [Gammaproteobacteria bacterium]MBT4075620.1 ABC transporter permease [Gammaproteobacteria bacterium]MBT4194993.1 ABC transporter permease [Gammaproteobacteria bacterium]MBT4449565.1 ABC transporter permease [Gammaproteobacteria bacterium]
MEILIPALLTIITAATPLLFAALGELVTEKSGVLNLGIEGMMVMGAIIGFVTVHVTGSATLAILASLVAGALMASIFAVLVLKFHASQVPTGLALTIFGIGLSALIGQSMIGIAYDGLPVISIPLLSSIPVLGELLFKHDILVFLSIVMVFVVTWFLYRSRAGLILRAVGDSHDAAHAMGYSVIKIRFLAILFGGAMAGVGGAYLSLAYSPLWVEQMTAGRGWIALALVVFATWRPGRVLLGAYLFGGITILQLHAQALGIGIPSQVMSMLPYLATIVVLVIISSDQSKIKLNSPASLGKAFHPSR